MAASPFLPFSSQFWQARYRAVRILDETALLACSAYVDLNPIRAALAETLEKSDFTSVQRRIRAIRLASAGETETRVDQGDASLARLEIDERRDPVGPCASASGLRATDKGFLPMTTAAYLDLLDWTTRRIRKGKRGATPRAARPIFERLGISAEVWCELVQELE